LDAFIVDVLEE
jgi:Ca2+-binding EF-hand superfamily protein